MAEAKLGGARPFAPFEFVIAMRYLRARRKEGGIALIAIISFIGIALGVAALIVVLSVMNGFRQGLFDQMLGTQSHVYVDVQDVDPVAAREMQRRIASLPEVESVGPRMSGQALLTARDRTTGAQIIGAEPQDLAAIPLITGRANDDESSGLIAGDFSTFGEGENGGENILIGRGLAMQLQVGIGDRITFTAPSGAAGPFGTLPRRKAYTVSGIFRSGVYEYDQIIVFMPLEQSLRFLEAERAEALEIRVSSPLEIEQATQSVRSAIGEDAFVFNWTHRNQSFYQALQTERVMMTIVMSFIVLIAAMNIITGLVMLVKNKGRDVAILRTMGATRGTIMRIFVLVGMFIGTVGATIGTVLGILVAVYIEPIIDFIEWITGAVIFSEDVYILPSLPSQINPNEVLYAVAFSLICAFLAAIIPAVRAAFLDPVEALRYE